MKPDCEVLRKRDFEVLPISHSDAAAFIREFHYSKSCALTSVSRHGLFRKGEAELLGVAMWMPPTKNCAVSVDRDWKGVLALTRLAAHPSLPQNAASFLMASSMRMIDRNKWHHFVTFADTAMGHTGAIYLATNWRKVSETAGGETWIMPNGSRCQRKRGPINLTVEDMRNLGASRAPRAAKIKFVYP